MKTVFLNGCYGACNLGDDLMMNIVIEDILKIFDNNVVIYVKHKGNKKCLCQNNSHIININVKKIDELILIKNSNYYIWGGGTFLYENKDNGIVSLLSILLHIIIAKLFKTKIILYGIGFGPFKTFLGRKIAEIIIKLSDFITVRDEESFLLINKLNKNSYLTEDLVYRVNIKKTNNSKQTDKINILINAVYYEEDKNLKKFSEFIFGKIIEMNIPLKNIHLHLIPAWENQYESDNVANKKVLKNLQKKYNFNFSIYEYNTLSEILSVIQSSDIVFAQRLHVLLLASLYGKRFFTIPYHTKIDKFIKEISYKQGNVSPGILRNKRTKSKKNFELLKNYLLGKYK